MPFIAEHKQRLLENRPRLETGFLHKMAPGKTHPAPDGSGSIIATDQTLIYLDAGGNVLRQESNRIPTTELVNGPEFKPANGKVTIAGLVDWANKSKSLSDALSAERPTVATKNGDDALFELYIKEAEVTGYPEREARAVWAVFKSLTDGNALKDCTRDDGRKLVAHFEGQGLKTASIRKKVMWLCSAVN
ncbi:MAG TPA: hypothetical protein VFN27_07270, partial [Xanthobacteraceae bacterium]|nr:hypothetical protein [Xanthobacteraceae bacterium]